ncbi:MAG: hypothetical protein IPQ16_12295 [Geobacteraceae bacterium]|nr:hypothetical protein [Geobacteraceae bacterium]
MLIQIMFPDNHQDFVKPGMLDPLIESRTITRFKRSSGWVTIGIDPVRKTHRGPSQLTPSDIRKLTSLLS